MKVTTKHERTVLNLIQGREGGDMRVNHEYQRGLRWTKRQKELFLDSVAREYPIPAFYLHKKTRESSFDGLTQVTYEVVDGQQRIEALWEYWKGAFKMPNPGRDTGLPASIQRQECVWAGKGWGELDKEVQKRILETRVVIHECETDDPNEMRDLFIRLQAGTPLSRQDKRDAWPGGFTEFVLQQAGKSQLPQYPGEPLWKRLTGGESARRQSMAQIYMQWESMRRTGRTCDHGANATDSFYHKNVDFEGRQDERQAFMATCRLLEDLLATRKTKLSVYMLLHSLLFVEAIKGTHGIPSGGVMVGAMKEFEDRLRSGRAADKEGKTTPDVVFEQKFGQYTRAGSDSGGTIGRRHSFFLNQMLRLAKVRAKDDDRSFTGALRSAIYLRDQGLCMWCRMEGDEVEVVYEEAEIHHVTPHSEGGKTTLENGATMHGDCHPKDSEKVAMFAEWWEKRTKGEGTER